MPIIYKTCSQCKIAKPIDEFPPDKRNPDGKQSRCRVCRAANQREYIRKYPDRKRESDKCYRQNNADHVREKKREWSLQNRERLNQQSAEWRKNNRERRNAIVRSYRKRNPEAYRISSHRYLTRKRNAEGECSPEEWMYILHRYAPDGRCPACGEQKKQTMDHIVPLSVGGTNFPYNLQPLCGNCNSTKGSKIIDFRR